MYGFCKVYERLYIFINGFFKEYKNCTVSCMGFTRNTRAIHFHKWVLQEIWELQLIFLNWMMGCCQCQKCAKLVQIKLTNLFVCLIPFLWTEIFRFRCMWQQRWQRSAKHHLLYHHQIHMQQLDWSGWVMSPAALLTGYIQSCGGWFKWFLSQSWTRFVSAVAWIFASEARPKRLVAKLNDLSYDLQFSTTFNP